MAAIVNQQLLLLHELESGIHILDHLYHFNRLRRGHPNGKGANAKKKKNLFGFESDNEFGAAIYF